VAVVSNGERTPYTTEVKLTDGEHVVVLRRLDVSGPPSELAPHVRT